MDWLDFLRRWRENYYASNLLAAIARPLERTCSGVAEQLRRRIRKNGLQYLLPNGKTLRIGRDSGLYLASALFWGGLDSFEPGDVANAPILLLACQYVCRCWSELRTLLLAGGSVEFAPAGGCLRTGSADLRVPSAKHQTKRSAGQSERIFHGSLRHERRSNSIRSR